MPIERWNRAFALSIIAGATLSALAGPASDAATATCKASISATGTGPAQKYAQLHAKANWTSLVQSTHGKAYSDLAHASQVRWSCNGSGGQIGCRLSARPCGMPNIKIGK